VETRRPVKSRAPPPTGVLENLVGNRLMERTAHEHSPTRDLEFFGSNIAGWCAGADRGVLLFACLQHWHSRREDLAGER
jgi:hypothetical protein